MANYNHYEYESPQTLKKLTTFASFQTIQYCDYYFVLSCSDLNQPFNAKLCKVDEKQKKNPIKQQLQMALTA